MMKLNTNNRMTNSNPQAYIQRLLTRKEAAAYLGIAEKTLWDWVNRGIIPQVKFQKSKPKYDIRDLDRIIEENKSSNNSHARYQKISTKIN
jgi:predicted site-specific integrase-resolvase